MKSIRAFFASRTGRLVVHDAVLGAVAGVTFVESTHTITWAVIAAAGAIALKVFLRLLLPAAPAAIVRGATKNDIVFKVHADTSQAVAALNDLTKQAKQASKAVGKVTK